MAKRSSTNWINRTCPICNATFATRQTITGMKVTCSKECAKKKQHLHMQYSDMNASFRGEQGLPEFVYKQATDLKVTLPILRDAVGSVIDKKVGK